MLEARDITVRYGGRAVVDGLSFTLEPGRWLMLVGPNGAGKSSLIRALAQAVPYEGEFLLEGRPLREMRPAERARRIGILAQHNAARYAYTVEEIVRLGRYAHTQGWLTHRDPEGEERVEAALRDTGMTDFRRCSVLELSGGEVQRAFLAQVFAQDPQLLVLDEPANHLDLKYQQQLFGLIGTWVGKPGRAVISVVHDLSLARRYGDCALLMHRGRCAARGSAEEIMRPGVLRAVYEMDVHAWMRSLLEPWAFPEAPAEDPS